MPETSQTQRRVTDYFQGGKLNVVGQHSAKHKTSYNAPTPSNNNNRGRAQDGGKVSESEKMPNKTREGKSLRYSDNSVALQQQQQQYLSENEGSGKASGAQAGMELSPKAVVRAHENSYHVQRRSVKSSHVEMRSLLQKSPLK